MEFPHLRDLYGRINKQGFELAAVNYGDDKAIINKYAKEEKFTFPLLMNMSMKDDISKMYGVSAYPTTYVIDAKGKIVARFVGFDEDGLKKALKKLGAKP